LLLILIILHYENIKKNSVEKCFKFPPGQPHQNLSPNIPLSLAISGLKSRISITAGKRSAACGRNVALSCLSGSREYVALPSAGCATLTCGYGNLTLRVIRKTDFDAVALNFLSEMEMKSVILIINCHNTKMFNILSSQYPILYHHE
jgi:hypothetical protein